MNAAKMKMFLVFLFILLILNAIPHGLHVINKSRLLHVKVENSNQVPYISTYYIKPIVKSGEEVLIDFYITDYNHREYVYDDYSNLFSVTIKASGQKEQIIKNLKAGDHQISLGTFENPGEVTFSLLCTDEEGRNSHELFNSFLVKNNKAQTLYRMNHSDLETYTLNNTSNDNTAFTNSIGLQKLLDDKKALGYDGITLYEGVYYVDYHYTLEIPDEFTLDLNNSTLKLKEFTGSNALMVSLKNKFDSHVKNGTIEGDYYHHDYKNSKDGSEWVNGIGITGSSHYCSFENLSVKNITGYGGINGIGKIKEDSPYYTSVPYIKIGNTFKNCDIDRKTGEEIKSASRSTCSFIDLKNHSSLPFISISRYLGYQGIGTDTFNILCHFYDENYRYIKTTDGYQYRRIQVPENSKYIRVTLLCDDCPEDLTINSFLLPVNCQFKNIDFTNCRCVGLANGAMNNMLIENCSFSHCGETLAKCALDAEDGWDLMQDITFRNLNFYDNENNDFLTCGGHNFIIENMKAGKMHFWERTNSYVVRNCKNIDNLSLYHGSHEKSGYVRIYDNKINASTKVVSKSIIDNWPVVIKNCSIHGKAENTLGSCLFLNCTIGKPDKTASLDNNIPTGTGEGNFIGCKIQNFSGENQGGNYDNCTFDNITGNLNGHWEIKNSSIENFNCNVLDENLNFSVDSSNLENISIKYGYWYKGGALTIMNSSIQNNSEPLLSLPCYSLSKPVNISGNTIISSSSLGIIYFYDLRTTEWRNNDKLSLINNDITLTSTAPVITGIDESKNMISLKLKDNKINTKMFKDSDK